MENGKSCEKITTRSLDRKIWKEIPWSSEIKREVSFGQQTATIGDVMEKETHGDGILMEMESSGRRSIHPRLLATWRSTGVLTYIGKVSNSGMTMGLEITTDIGDAVPSGDEPNSKLINGDFISHQLCLGRRALKAQNSPPFRIPGCTSGFFVSRCRSILHLNCEIVSLQSVKGRK